MSVYFNVAGKQKNLAGNASKLSNIIRQIIANPQGFVQAMQIPQVAKTFNQIMEASGLDQVNFGAMKAPVPSPIQPDAVGAVAEPELTS